MSLSIRQAFRFHCPVCMTVVFIFLSFFQLQAQENFALDRDAVLPYDKLSNSPAIQLHTSVKPYLDTDLKGIDDSGLNYRHFRPQGQRDSTKKNNSIRFQILPFNSLLSGGYDIKNHTAVGDAVGSVNVRFSYANKLAVVLNCMGGYSIFPSYVDSAIKNTRVVPGIGSAYKNGNAYSYQQYTGYLSYSPNHIFNIQLGNDKNFFGDGYRSMFLSDNSASYPFLKIRTHVGPFEYVNLYTMMLDATAPSGLSKDFKRKYTSMQYLSWNVSKRINLCFFESIVWQGNDTNRVRGFDVNYLNPVAFLRPTEYSLGSADNALLGAGGKIKLPRQVQLYGQVLLDEFVLKELLARSGWWGNKFSIQAGMKAFDLFGIKNLYMQGEVNYVRPYTYTHGSVQQNYGNYNQPLADPFGANFEEVIGILDYRYKRFIFELKGVVAFTGLDTAGSNVGQNIFLSYDTRTGGTDIYHDYGHHLGDGLKTVIGTTEFRTSYLILPAYNMKAELALTYYTLHSSGRPSQDAALISFGIKTSLYNTYRDY